MYSSTNTSFGQHDLGWVRRPQAATGGTTAFSGVGGRRLRDVQHLRRPVERRRRRVRRLCEPEHQFELHDTAARWRHGTAPTPGSRWRCPTWQPTPTVKGSFSAAVDVRYDQYSGTVRSFEWRSGGGAPQAATSGAQHAINGRGVAVNAKLVNRFDFGERYYVEPLLCSTGHLQFRQRGLQSGLGGHVRFNRLPADHLAAGKGGRQCRRHVRNAFPTIQLGPFRSRGVERIRGSRARRPRP